MDLTTKEKQAILNNNPKIVKFGKLTVTDKILTKNFKVPVTFTGDFTLPEHKIVALQVPHYLFSEGSQEAFDKWFKNAVLDI